MPYYDPVTNEWVDDTAPPERPSQMTWPSGQDFGGYSTQPNRPLMGMFTNAAPPVVQSQPAYGGTYEQVRDPLSGAEYSKWPTDTGFVQRSSGYADMGDPNQATGLADWMARTMARAQPDMASGEPYRRDILQFLQARDPMGGTTFQKGPHVEPQIPGPRVIPWTPEMMRPPTVSGGEEAVPGEQAQPTTEERREDTGPTRVQPVGAERVPQGGEIRPAQAQPGPDMRARINEARDADLLTAAATGQAGVDHMTEPDDSGTRYPVLGTLSDGARLVMVQNTLMVWTPDEGYKPLSQTPYARLVDPRLRAIGSAFRF